MQIRKIEKRDNEILELIIKQCLKEYDGQKEGCAFTDPCLANLYEEYLSSDGNYWVVEELGDVLGGCGIGPVPGKAGVCELQKMYLLPQARGTGIATKLLEVALTFAKVQYQTCYIETFSNMVEANAFYAKNGFTRLEQRLVDGPHFACDVWYIKELKNEA
ncbi:GNAT family N-acetyltransferase [Tannockella kyphosi]|uniref:GNAT family N-acetyltransferase n=1 Tax=Tannockella kyphosi TaxID=2899121 RepID=UPI002011E260|nr:GNAT family N-acetyltransferase [Tannockella kyphosi]